jgi:hypothetical protein
VVEGELVVRGERAGEQLLAAMQDPAVELRHRLDGHGIARRVEACQVAEQEAAGVADLAIALGSGVMRPCEKLVSAVKSTEAKSSAGCRRRSS